MLHSYECMKPLQSVSDHYVIECQTQFKSNFNQHEEVKPDLFSPFDKLNFFSEDINWEQLGQDLESVDWSNEFKSMHPNDMLSKLMEMTIDVCNRHVPVKRLVHKQSPTQIPRERRILMRKRSALTRKLKNNTSDIRRRNIEGKQINIEIIL